MRYENTPQLSGWLEEDFPLLSAMPGFTLDDAEYQNHLASLNSRPSTERQDAAAFRCLTHGKFAVTLPQVHTPSGVALSFDPILSELKQIRTSVGRLQNTPAFDDASIVERLDRIRADIQKPEASPIPGDVYFDRRIFPELAALRKLMKWGFIGIGILLLMLFGAMEAHAQNSNVAVVVANCGTAPTNIPAASAGSPNRVYLTVDTNGQICINGTITGGNAAASATGAAVPANADYIGLNISGTLRGATGTNTSGSVYAIDTNCVAGCAGGTNDVDDGTIANGQTTGIQLPLNYVYDGTNWKRLTVGTAGSGSTQFISVQGSASGTPIPVSGTVSVTGVAGTEYIQDAALTVATTQGGMAMGRASAAAPTSVSADNDAVLPWYTRAGAQVSELAIGGTFVPSGHGTASNAIRVELPTDGTGRMATVDTVTVVGSVTSLTNSLPAGTNAIGKLSANSGVDIGDVDVTSIMPGTGATNLGKAIDTATGATDTGVLALATRDDALTTLTPADGDNVQLRTNSTGALWVQSSIIDAAEGAAVATNPVPIGGVYRSSPVTLDAGDVGYPLLDVNGRLIVNCNTGCSGGTQYTQDAALTIASSIVTLSGGRASAAVPTGVSADDDAVIAWYLRSGAQATQPTFGGVLGVAGNGASGTGVQRVTIANDSTGILALTTGSAQIGHLEANQSVNVAQINGVTTLMGNGASGTGAQRVTIANDSTGVLATVSTVTTLSQLGGVALPIEDAAETPAGVGIYAMGVRRDTPASSAGTTGDNTMASYSADGGMWVASIPSTAGGLTFYVVEPGASDNHANIKNGAGQVYTMQVFTKHTAAQYLRLYNAASGFNGCNSATNLQWEGIIPAASTGAGYVFDFPQGLTFATGISICVTGAYGQTDTTSATASVSAVNIGYK